MAHDPVADVAQRAQATFAAVADGPMRGLPLNHPRLHVQALGFESWPGEPAFAFGVLVTPWAMNLLRVALRPDAPRLPVGAKRLRALGGSEFEFIGAEQAAFGRYEMCSLFSPMFQFADHGAALATAREVLALLRADSAPPVEPVPARRGFLFGRSAAARHP